MHGRDSCFAHIGCFRLAAENEDACNMELESPVTILKELLRLALEDLEMARKSSERLAEKARKMGEKAMTLSEEAADAERAANEAKAEVDEIHRQESEGRIIPYDLCTLADVPVKL